METFINPTPLFWALGPAALTRLVAGLADRTVSVRSAAGQAVDAWCQAGKSVLEGSDPTLTNLMDFPLCIPCLSICILYMPCLSMMLM